MVWYVQYFNILVNLPHHPHYLPHHPHYLPHHPHNLPHHPHYLHHHSHDVPHHPHYLLCHPHYLPHHPHYLPHHPRFRFLFYHRFEKLGNFTDGNGKVQPPSNRFFQMLNFGISD